MQMHLLCWVVDLTTTFSLISACSPPLTTRNRNQVTCLQSSASLSLLVFRARLAHLLTLSMLEKQFPRSLPLLSYIFCSSPYYLLFSTYYIYAHQLYFIVPIYLTSLRHTAYYFTFSICMLQFSDLTSDIVITSSATLRCVTYSYHYIYLYQNIPVAHLFTASPCHSNLILPLLQQVSVHL